MKGTYEHIVVDGSMTGTAVINSSVSELDEAIGVAFQVSWSRLTAILGGSVKIQVSNSPDAANAEWTDLAGATGTVTDTATGSIVIVVSNAYFRIARLVYTNATGTGTLQVRSFSKG